MDVVLSVPQSIYERAVLFDTSALEAIVDNRDQYHYLASRYLNIIKNQNYPFYVTTLTIAETQRRLLYKISFGREKTIGFVESMYDGSMNVVRPSDEDDVAAIEYCRRFSDQNLTLTDTVSMAIMKRLGIRKVFTFDWHFTLLGFQVVPGDLYSSKQ